MAMKRVCTNCETSKTPMWRWGPTGERTLCNACGVRQQRFEKKLLKNKKITDAVAYRAAAAAARLAARGGLPVKPRKWIRPSRSKAAVSARERALSNDNEVPWLPEAFCQNDMNTRDLGDLGHLGYLGDLGDLEDLGDLGDQGDQGDQRGHLGELGELGLADDIGMYFYNEGGAQQHDIDRYLNCCEGEEYGDGWCVGEEFQNIDDVEECYELEKSSGCGSMSPRSPFMMMWD